MCLIRVFLQVRLAVLHILNGMYTKLGESLLVLLPETIPFLAELLEGTLPNMVMTTCCYYFLSDDEPQVEQLCQQFIKTIEQLLGESIQQYF